jgi:hypothetical protein
MERESQALQTALYESYQTSVRPASASSSAHQSLSRPETPKSGRRLNTLSREGIAPANIGIVAGSTFGKAGNRRYSASDHQRSHETIADLRRFTPKKPSHVKDQGTPSALFLPRSQWISLGDGWFQTTPIGTGNCNRTGLHSLVESSLGQLFICVYEPRSTVGVSSCLSECPNYDLEISLKTIRAKNAPARQSFEVLLGFKSATEYLTLALDSDQGHGQWTFGHVTGNTTHVIAVVEASDIRPNVFYSVLLQVRDTLVSVDVDGVPIFTSLRIPSPATSLSGLMGLLAKVLLLSLLSLPSRPRRDPSSR